MAQQPAINDMEEAQPRSYRELYPSDTYQAGEPEPARLLASYRFNEIAGDGERPTPDSLKEQTFALSERRQWRSCVSRVLEVPQ